MSSRSSGSGTGLLVVAAIIGGSYWFVTQYDDMTIKNRVGSHPVSDITTHRNEAKPLSVMAKSLPRFLAAREQVATRSRVRATGVWSYVVETNNRKFTLSDAFLEPAGELAGFRIDRSFRSQWYRMLMQVGYSSVSRRPPHMQMKSFAITSPEGIQFNIGKDRNDAQLMANLALMVGCKEFEGDPESLMAVTRGTLAHAVMFSGLTEKLSLNDKLRLSCAKDPKVREFAAEMLASLLPRFPAGEDGPLFSASAYRSAIAQLARPVTVEQKERTFRSLVQAKSWAR